ncbi:MAG: cobyric acid synthase CobQ, partial [Xanthobacteraceae bacterium]
IGTYIHGLFADDCQRAAWLNRFAAGATNLAYDASIERTLDALAAHLAAHLDLEALLKLAR